MMRQIKISIALLLTALLLLTGCSQKGDPAKGTASQPETMQSQSEENQTQPEDQSGSKAQGEGTITFTDMNGREITLDGPADRIVALTASDCEILYALGAGDTLVGRGGILQLA